MDRQLLLALEKMCAAIAANMGATRELAEAISNDPSVPGYAVAALESLESASRCLGQAEGLLKEQTPKETL